MIVADLATAFEDNFNKLDSGGQSAIKAQALAKGIANAVNDGFSSQVLAVVSVVGAIPGAPPVPYANSEPPFSGQFQKAVLQAELMQGYVDLLAGGKAGVLAQFAQKESKLLAGAIANYFLTGIFMMSVHTGPPLAATPLQASLMQPIIMSALLSAYTPDSVGMQAIKAKTIATGINNALMAAIPTVTLAGAVTQPPVGSAVGILT